MKSFIEYSSQCEFPIQNLPYGIFSTTENVSKSKCFTKFRFLKLFSFYFFFYKSTRLCQNITNYNFHKWLADNFYPFFIHNKYKLYHHQDDSGRFHVNKNSLSICNSSKYYEYRISRRKQVLIPFFFIFLWNIFTHVPSKVQDRKVLGVQIVW